MDIAIASTPASARSQLGSALMGTGRAALAAYKLGGLAFIAAPAIVAIAVLPEFAQHAAEIHLGMFQSKEAFHAAENDPLRWTFAHAKTAGLILTMLLTARFWAVGSVRATLLVPPRDLVRIGIAVALTELAV